MRTSKIPTHFHLMYSYTIQYTVYTRKQVITGKNDSVLSNICTLYIVQHKMNELHNLFSAYSVPLYISLNRLHFK